MYCLQTENSSKELVKNKGIQKNSMQAINLGISDFENFLIKDKDLERNNCWTNKYKII